MLTLIVVGATADFDGGGQAISAEARQFASLGAEGAEHRDKGLRFTRRTRPRIHLLAVIVHRSGRREGASRHAHSDPVALTNIIQAVVLAIRPPITIPRTTVSAALLDELLGEIPLLASVYHKPAETFVGRGRIGADSVQKKE